MEKINNFCLDIMILGFLLFFPALGYRILFEFDSYYVGGLFREEWAMVDLCWTLICIGAFLVLVGFAGTEFVRCNKMKKKEKCLCCSS